jgi:steroid 5-alpha reductase family enzyme
MPLIPLVVIGLGLSLFMALAWCIQRITGSSGWVDATWSASVGAGGLAAVLLGAGPNGMRRALAATLVLAWSARLALHIARRTIGAGDDPRYAALQLQWGDSFPARLFLFLQIQAIAAFILVFAVYCAATNPVPFPGVFDWLALIVAVVSIAGEATADVQLARFRTLNRGRSAICDRGLWRYSRHPNYFFEWLWWCTWPLLAFDFAGHGLLAACALLAPVMMYWLLVHVSGIPPLEAHMLETRGEAYRGIQARVNAFFPGPPRNLDEGEKLS